MTTIERRRHTAEQAVRKVREGEPMPGAGSDLAEVLRHLEITESTWHEWRRAYTGQAFPRACNSCCVHARTANLPPTGGRRDVAGQCTLRA